MIDYQFYKWNKPVCGLRIVSDKMNHVQKFKYQRNVLTDFDICNMKVYNCEKLVKYFSNG